MRAWFQGPKGGRACEAHLQRIVADLCARSDPAFDFDGRPVSCPRRKAGYPMIGYTASLPIAVLTGCAGTSAKSSDEIGRLGAELLLSGGISLQGYSTDFTPQFR